MAITVRRGSCHSSANAAADRPERQLPMCTRRQSCTKAPLPISTQNVRLCTNAHVHTYVKRWVFVCMGPRGTGACRKELGRAACRPPAKTGTVTPEIDSRWVLGERVRNQRDGDYGCGDLADHRRMPRRERNARRILARTRVKGTRTDILIPNIEWAIAGVKGSTWSVRQLLGLSIDTYLSL